jgi:hypothetical protein
MKKCTKCNIEKIYEDFNKAIKTKDGFNGICKTCITKYKKIYYLINQCRLKEKSKINGKEYYKNNSKEIIFKSKTYNKINSEKINKKIKDRKFIDNLFKLKCNIRSLISISIKKQGYTKKSKSNKILGCSFEEFKIYLEKQFTEGMSWENQGKWHFDHIYPVSLAKSEEELIKLNNYTNFQPLWAIDNIKKGNKI